MCGWWKLENENLWKLNWKQKKNLISKENIIMKRNTMSDIWNISDYKIIIKVQENSNEEIGKENH